MCVWYYVCCQLTHYRNGVQSMCKYCDTNSLKKMHDEVNAILSEDYYDGIEDKWGLCYIIVVDGDGDETSRQARPYRPKNLQVRP